MPLPRLDDDQKYWEERCHKLEREIERFSNAFDFAENMLLHTEALLEDAQREVERLEWVKRTINLVWIDEQIAQAREKALEEAARIAENMEDIVDPVSGKVWYPNAHDAADEIRQRKSGGTHDTG